MCPIGGYRHHTGHCPATAGGTAWKHRQCHVGGRGSASATGCHGGQGGSHEDSLARFQLHRQWAVGQRRQHSGRAYRAGQRTSTSTSTAGVGIIPSAASASPTSAANIIFGIIPAQFQGLLQALKTEGLAKTLAEPKLVTQSGRPARILSGGQQAVLSSASGINGPGVSFQNIGTTLEFLPIVYGNGKIYLEVAPQVRAVNQGLGITTTFGTVPGFDEQSVRTSVVMESGQTFAIGGLIQTDLQSSTSRVPVLGDIPFLSFFFSQITVTEEEQELVILVTPHLVDPMDCNQVPKRLPGRESRRSGRFRAVPRNHAGSAERTAECVRGAEESSLQGTLEK